MKLEHCTVGAEVVWHCVPRGGYGFSVRIPATIRAVGKAKVTIDARPLSGTPIRRAVHPDSLWTPETSALNNTESDWQKACDRELRFRLIKHHLVNIRAVLAQYTFSAPNESVLQARVQAVLSREGPKLGWEPAREVRVPGIGQYDITIVDPIAFIQIVLELKVKGGAAAVERQAQRYALTAGVDAVVVVTNSQRLAAKLTSGTLGDKPFQVITLRSVI